MRVPITLLGRQPVDTLRKLQTPAATFGNRAPGFALTATFKLALCRLPSCARMTKSNQRWLSRLSRFPSWCWFGNVQRIGTTAASIHRFDTRSLHFSIQKMPFTHSFHRNISSTLNSQALIHREDESRLECPAISATLDRGLPANATRLLAARQTQN